MAGRASTHLSTGLRASTLAATLWSLPTFLAASDIPIPPPLSERVGRIEIERKNVFDPAIPGENWWPFRLANRIHIMSRESVIRHEVLLKEGDFMDPLKAIETERNLRSLGFIRSAHVHALPGESGLLDLRVTTQDSWTLKPQFGVGTEGGDHFLVYGIEENNLLGLGKTISFFHAQVGAELRNELRYVDPRIWATWFRLTSLYAKTHRGDEIGAQLERPFFSLETPYATRLSWARIIEEDILYQNAAETSKFIENLRAVQASAALKSNRNPRFVQRLHAGYLYEKSDFDPQTGTAPGTLPENRTLSGPWLGHSWIVADYIKETDINSMKRVEDFNLGNEFSVQTGPMLSAFGADKDRWIFSAQNQQGLSLGEGRFALAQVGTQGRLARNGRLENSILYANLNVFWKTRWPFPQTFVSHMEFNTTRLLDGENQIVLGGNTGLRGYKNNSFTGSRSLLLNFEDRFFYHRHFFHLVYLGGAVFLDVGAAAPSGQPLTQDHIKSNIGVGLRLSPSRSTSGGVLRMDLAYALNGGPGGSRWVVSIRGGQAFSIFNSTNRRVLRPSDAVLTEEAGSTRLRRR